MKSGKTRELLNRVDKLSFVENCSFVLFKPTTDVRDSTVKSRFGSLTTECTFIDDAKPSDILQFVDENTDVVAIDEAQFFSEEIIDVVRALAKRNVYVLISGLELDFRGEPFGPMPALLALADNVVKLHAVCEVPGCSNIGTRPQRLVKGKPASYHDPQVLVGDEEHYEPRCVNHHIVPDSPHKKYAVLDSSLVDDTQ